MIQPNIWKRQAFCIGHNFLPKSLGLLVIGLVLVFLFGSDSGFAQGNSIDKPGKVISATPGDTQTPPPSTMGVTAVDAAAEFPSDLPVVTYLGPCETQKKTPQAKGCKITLRRADIDTVINTLAPTSSASVRRQLALNYSRLAAASAVSENLHLDRNPAVEKQIQLQQKLVRMQILANALNDQIEARTGQSASIEVEKYYATHRSNFIRGDVHRLTIPKSISPETQPADIVALKTLAENYEARAAAGEDIDQLQEQVLKDFGLKISVPPTKISMARPANLPPTERVVFDLEPGQATPVLESASAFTILKLDSKQPVPLEVARPEILILLQHDRGQEEKLKVSAIADMQFNLRYFGLMTQPEILPPPQISGVTPEQNSQANPAQRAAGRRPAMTRKR